jgi:hypothetical protein
MVDVILGRDIHGLSIHELEKNAMALRMEADRLMAALAPEQTLSSIVREDIAA